MLKTDESAIGGKLQEDVAEKNTITPSSFNDESETESQRSTEPGLPQAPKKSGGQRR